MTESHRDTPSSAPNYRVLGENTKVEVARSSADDNRDWLLNAPVCSALSRYNIIHVGVMHAQAPFHIARANQSGTFMLACFEGEGQVLADGRWKTLKAGNACLLPPFAANELRCIPGKEWSFCWVRYLESESSQPIVSETSPLSAEYNPEPLRHAIRGLIAETSKAECTSSLVSQWIELTHQYVLAMARPHHGDERLWKLWKEVKKDVARHWTLSELAKLVHMSDEHLRRLCKKQLGRSPMQHLSYLRIKLASEMLTGTDEKIETIAFEVGYASAAHFSDVFVKWVGCRPSEYRAN